MPNRKKRQADNAMNVNTDTTLGSGAATDVNTTAGNGAVADVNTTADNGAAADAKAEEQTEEVKKKHKSTGLFDKDNGFNRTLGLLGSLILVNIYFVLCSLPILTIGASLTALNHVCYLIMEEEDVRITPTFFKTFVKSLLDATLVWIIGLGFLSAFAFGIYQFILNASGATQVIGAGICGIGAILAAIELTYYFAVLARYKNMILAQIKDAFIIGFTNLGWTLVIWVMWAVAIGIFVLFPNALVYAGWIWLLIGFAALLSVTCRIYRRIFKKLEKLQEDRNKKDQNKK